MNNKKGFTIIEVVLVLAIAGLIFLMVFIVIPQAMAGQRDSERRQDMARVHDALIQYQANNKFKRNNLPNAPGGVSYRFTDKEDGEGFSNKCDKNVACNFIKNYLNTADSIASGINTFLDPDGVPYNMYISENLAECNGSINKGGIDTGNGVNSKLVTLKEEVNENGTMDSVYTIGGTEPFKLHVVYVIPGGKCDGEAVVTSDLRHFAILYRLENAGVYCVDSD